jgi:hypothetical protein
MSKTGTVIHKPSKFKMRPRPKKPSEPRTITFQVGSYVTLGYMNECVEKFKAENPDRSEREIMLSVETMECWREDYTIILSAPPQSQRNYEAKLNEYKLELKAYKSWQKAHEKEIDKHKIKEKKAAAKRRLNRTLERLSKEIEKVEAKLVKS